MNRKLKLIGVLFLSICIAVFATGCRESLVLTQILHSQLAEEQDLNNDTKVAQNDKNSTQEDEELKTEKKKDDKKESEIKKIASAKGNSKNEGSSSKTVQDDKSTNDGKSDEGERDRKGKDDKGGKDGSGKDKNKDKKPGKDKDDKPGKDDGNKDDGNDNNDNDGGGGESDDPNSRQIYDDDGNEINLPEEVNSVVAAGDAAIIVQMVGGKGVITGTSSDVKDGKASSVFSDEKLGDAESCWYGDGNSPMDESSFNKLLDEKPDACVAISGSGSFSDSQISRLKEKKIAYVTLPRLNTADNIEKAVEIAGDIVGNRSNKSGGMNGPRIARKYKEFCGDLVDLTSSANGGIFTYNNTDFNNDYSLHGRKSASGTTSNGKYTLYVSGWDGSSHFRLKSGDSEVFSESGVAETRNGYSESPISYYMSVGGVLNNAARYSEDSCRTYAAIPLNINVLNPELNGNLSYYRPTNESFIRVKDGSADDDVCLGSDDFPAIVVDSSQTKNNISSSDMWENYGKVTLGSRTDYGFVAEDTMVTTYIRGDYDIYVNPYGVVSWADGSVESVLESVWAAWKINGCCSESDVKSAIKDFYSEFYRYDVSDGEISSILAGK